MSLDTELSEQDYIFWEEDLPTPKSIASELNRWKRVWTIPSNLLEALGSCDADIYYLLTIGCALPITSAEAEQTFSLLCRIKTYTRSTLQPEHFSDLAVIAMHYEQKIPVETVLEEFLSKILDVSLLTLFENVIICFSLILTLL